MILHCVFVRFKSALQHADKQAIYDAIAALKNVIPGILDLKYGPNVSPEGLNGGFLDGFVVTFENPEARDAYLVHGCRGADRRIRRRWIVGPDGVRSRRLS